MAFAHLFARLSAVEEDVTSPGQTAFTHSNDTENGKRGNARRRKNQCEQTGLCKKKQCHQAQTARGYKATSDGSKETHYHMHNTESEHDNVAFTEEVMQSHSKKASHNNIHHKGQNYKTKNNRNVNKHQEQRKKTEGQKNQHQQRGKGRHASRGGNHQTRPNLRKGGGKRKNKNNEQDSRVKRKKFMTQEFKEQNALLVDGRFLCRHFLWERCIKGGDCQLEHVQGYNGIIKEVCKFYIQGFCAKGESCPYMHKSFPCKFFHKRGKCSQGADCRFSHEPLNDVTNRLLVEALQRENDLYELAKKAEQKSSGQPANTAQSEITEANRTPDIFKQPMWPTFYKSTDTSAVKDITLRQTEELSDNVEKAVPPHESDAAQPHSPPSTNLSHEEPVCYSVEAVLRPHLSKPFTGFFTTPRSQEFAPLPSLKCPSDSADQSHVPYSVEAVLKSCKSEENSNKSTFGSTSTPLTAQTVSYTPTTCFEEITDPLLSSENPYKKVSYSRSTRNKANKSQEKIFNSLPSLQVHTGLISKTCPNDTLASGDHKKQGLNMSESLKPAQRASHEVQLELQHLPMDITSSLNCKGEGVLPKGPTNHKSIFSRPPTQTSTSKHPEQLKPHLSVLKCNSQASFKPFCPSSGFTEFKGRADVPAEPVTSPVKSNDAANSVSRHFAAQQPTKNHLCSKKTQSVLGLDTKQEYSTETTAECSNRKAHCNGLADGCKKKQKRPFHSLFASPITDTPQTIDDSVTGTSYAQGLTQSPCPGPQSADCKSNPLQTVLKPDKASARSFLSLFAAPLNAAALPCMQSQTDYSRTSSCSQQSVRSVENSSHLSDSEPGASSLESPVPHHVRTDVIETSDVPRFPNSAPDPKIGPCGESHSTSQDHQQLPSISSCKGSAAAATADSVLKTLFLCLNPYQQDGEQQDSIQISVPSEHEKMDKRSTGGVFLNQQQKSKTKRRQKKKLETQDSHKQSTEETAAHSREHQPSLQTSQISLEATGGSILRNPEMTDPQVRGSGTHKLPFNPVGLLMKQHTLPRLRHASEEGQTVTGNKAATPLKDLFKTLDTAVFQCGHL